MAGMCEHHGEVSENQAVVSEKVGQLEKRVDKIDVILEKVSGRLPVWATFTFGIMTAAIGWLISKL